jgi:hypothetical protein
MDEERLDLSVLDPRRDPVRWERMVAAVVMRAAPRALRERGPLSVLAGWARPTMAAAAFVGVVSAALLAYSLDRGAEERPALTIAESILPQPLDEWVADDRVPGDVDLLGTWNDAAPVTFTGGVER